MTAEDTPTPSHANLPTDPHDPHHQAVSPPEPPSAIAFLPAKFSNSPVLASSPFDPVLEEQEHSDTEQPDDFFEAEEHEEADEAAELELAA